MMKIRSVSAILWKLKDGCNKTRFKPLKKSLIFLYEVCQYFNGSWIPWDSHFEGTPCLPHGMQGIFISRAAKIGKNCVVFQQVTIGSNTLPDSKNFGSPIIGDNCYIGAGAKIIGRLTIGNNVRIGANCVVYRSVPDNSVVFPGDQTVLKKEKLNNRFYSFHGTWHFYHDGRWVQETDKKIISNLPHTF